MDEHLTQPQGQSLAAKQFATAPGMAMWASTGPDGKTCRECRFWASANGGKYKRNGGVLHARRCGKYTQLRKAQLMGAGPAIEPTMPSCRYFEQAKSPPNLETKR
jgi:hypothetical protein